MQAVQCGQGSLAPVAFWSHHPGAARASTTTLLVAPGDPGGDAAGGHGGPTAACQSIASFVREARPEQQQALWHAVFSQVRKAP
jgi:hypothetical protein